MHPQALPLQSYRFQKVGKKPELTLVWEPEDAEQGPAQQVRPGGGAAFPERHWVPVHPTLGEPPPASWACSPGLPSWAPGCDFRLYPARPAVAPRHHSLGLASWQHLPSPQSPTLGRGSGLCLPP